MTRLLAGDWRYDVTPEDRLWLLRAVHAEGPPSEDVARALVNLFAWSHASGKVEKPRRTLGALVRSYATPLMPTRRDSPEGSALRKARLAHSARVVFSRSAQDAVARALGTPWRSDITDYGAWWLDSSDKYTARSAPKEGANRMWTRDANWKGYDVETTVDAATIVQALRAIGAKLPAADTAKIEQAITTLTAMAPVGAVELDLRIANGLEAAWDAAASYAHDLGVKVKDTLIEAGIDAAKATQLVASAAIDTVTRPAREVVQTLRWPIAIAALLALVLVLRK